ncbi:MAG: hypothetical protein GY790_23315 [Bacteroidetes bacterium]|nr:hypothetical protein [Bacteroidota bacterium]
MKINRYLITAIVCALVTLSACNQEEESGRLSMGFELTEEGLLKAAATMDHLSTALITIMGEDGSLVYDKEPLELIRFGTGLVTRSLTLPVGGYKLTGFMLTDTSGTVLWATPKEGSKLAGLVRKPLPHSFRIGPQETTSVDIQVVRVRERPPADFGYAEFNIHFVEGLCLKVNYATRMPDCGIDSLMGPDGSTIPYYQSRLLVFAGDRKVLDKPMIPGVNRYKLPLVSKWYLVMATACDGTTIFKQDFHIDELRKYGCSPDSPGLVIHRSQDSGVIITPEGLNEPSISQGVFGRITASPDEAWADSVNAMIPLVRDICIFPGYLLDSFYTFAPMGCHIGFDMISEEPKVVVRSNSDGFFQAKLREGEYLYLVKEEQGYYLDAFMSSRKPGYIEVFPEELTKLMIHWVDCSKWL